ncbi:MAG: hypothetical protein ACXAC7_18895, partial [Candidatus Hodarchaeales archaeon]
QYDEEFVKGLVSYENSTFCLEYKIPLSNISSTPDQSDSSFSIDFSPINMPYLIHSVHVNYSLTNTPQDMDNIIIDGNFSDWVGISPLLQNVNTLTPIQNISTIYIVNDNDFIYFCVDYNNLYFETFSSLNLTVEDETIGNYVIFVSGEINEHSSIYIAEYYPEIEDVNNRNGELIADYLNYTGLNYNSNIGKYSIEFKIPLSDINVTAILDHGINIRFSPTPENNFEGILFKYNFSLTISDITKTEISTTSTTTNTETKTTSKTTNTEANTTSTITKTETRTIYITKTINFSIFVFITNFILLSYLRIRRMKKNS